MSPPRIRRILHGVVALHRVGKLPEIVRRENRGVRMLEHATEAPLVSLWRVDALEEKREYRNHGHVR